MNLYYASKNEYENRTILNGSVYFCFPNITGALEYCNGSGYIYLIKPKSNFKENSSSIYQSFSGIKIIKKTETLEIVQEFLGRKDFIGPEFSEFLDFNNVSELQMKEIYGLVAKSNKLNFAFEFVKCSKVDSKMLEDIIDGIGTDNSIVKVTSNNFNGVFNSILENPNINEQLLEKMINNKYLTSYSYIINQEIFSCQLYDSVIDNIGKSTRPIDDLAQLLKKQDLNYDQILKITIITNNLINLAKLPFSGIFDCNYDYTNFSESVYKNLLNTIKHPLVDSEMLKTVLKNIKCINKSNLNKLFLELLNTDKFNQEIGCAIDNYLLNTINLEIIDIMIEKKLISSKVIENIFLKNDDFENILKKMHHYDIFQEFLRSLKSQINETGDLTLFLELYKMENLITKYKVNDQSEDSELPKINIKKEKLKQLNRYLLDYKFSNIRQFIIKEMVKDGFLKKEYLIDPNYIKDCPRCYKDCHVYNEIIKEQTKIPKPTPTPTPTLEENLIKLIMNGRISNIRSH